MIEEDRSQTFEKVVAVLKEAVNLSWLDKKWVSKGHEGGMESTKVDMHRSCL